MFNPTWIYVGLLYAAAVWLARRVVDIPWRVAALFYFLVLIFLFRPMTQDTVNLPVDFLKSLPPWNHVTRDHHVDNPELNDLTLQIVPWAHQVRESWLSLQAPLWNNLSGSGYPLLANGQSSALSPLRLLALPLPLGYSFTAEAAMKLLIALTFTYLYCRNRRYGELPSVIGAICFGFSSFLIVWLHFPLATAAAFLPAVLFHLDLLIERRTFGRVASASIVWAALLLSGHPETAAHAFFLATLTLIWILAVERPLKTLREVAALLGTLSITMIAAAFLAAPFLAPFAEAITKSKRFHELQVERNAIPPYSDYASAIVLFQPTFYGALPGEKSWGPTKAESITGFAGVLGIASWFALLIGTVRARSWRSRETFYLVATFIVFGIILAWPVINPLFHLVFGLAANARLRLLFCFLLAVQTAAALDRRDRLPLLIGLLVVAAMFLYLMVTIEFRFPSHRDQAMIAILPSLVVIAAALLAIAPLPGCGERVREAGVRGVDQDPSSGLRPPSPRKRGEGQQLRQMILLVLIVNELWTVSAKWNPVRPRKEMYPSTPLIRKLQQLRTPEPFRIVGLGPGFFVNAPAMFGLEDIRAHDPMSNGRYLGLLRTLTKYDVADYFAKWQDIETHLLDFLNVKYIVAPPKSDLNDPGRYRLVYDGKDGRIFQNMRVLPRFYPTPIVILEFKGEGYVKRLVQIKDWSDVGIVKTLPVENDRMRSDLLNPRPANSPVATLKLLQAKPTDFRMRVQAPRYSLIVSSQPFWPGWKVVANGREVEPLLADGAFIGFTVRPGTTDVRVYYDPWTFKLGVALAVATILIGIFYSIFRGRGYRLAPEVEQEFPVASPPVA